MGRLHLCLLFFFLTSPKITQSSTDGTGQPETTTGPGQPETTTGPGEAETTDPGEPETTDPGELETTDPGEPETTDSGEPETTDPGEQETTTGPDDSQTTTGPGQPETTTGPGQPETTTGPGQPETTTGPGQPETTTGPGQPETTVTIGPDQPQSSVVPEQPTTMAPPPPGLKPPSLGGKRFKIALRIVFLISYSSLVNGDMDAFHQAVRDMLDSILRGSQKWGFRNVTNIITREYDGTGAARSLIVKRSTDDCSAGNCSLTTYDAEYDAESILANTSYIDEIFSFLEETALPRMAAANVTVNEIEVYGDHMAEEIGRLGGLEEEMRDDVCDPCALGDVCPSGYECVVDVGGVCSGTTGDGSGIAVFCVGPCHELENGAAQYLCDEKSQICRVEGTGTEEITSECSCKDNYLAVVGDDYKCFHQNILIGVFVGLGAAVIVIIIVVILLRKRRTKEDAYMFADENSYIIPHYRHEAAETKDGEIINAYKESGSYDVLRPVGDEPSISTVSGDTQAWEGLHELYEQEAGYEDSGVDAYSYATFGKGSETGTHTTYL